MGGGGGSDKEEEKRRSSSQEVEVADGDETDDFETESAVARGVADFSEININSESDAHNELHLRRHLHPHPPATFILPSRTSAGRNTVRIWSLNSSGVFIVVKSRREPRSNLPPSPRIRVMACL